MITNKLEGIYTFIVYDKDDKVKQFTHHNLITNDGKRTLMGHYGSYYEIFKYLALSTDTKVPSADDVSLVGEIKRIRINEVRQNLINDSDNYYHTVECKALFARGQVSGNISKVGIFSESNKLISVVKLLDSKGSESTFTLLETDRLEIRYEVRFHLRQIKPLTITNLRLSDDIVRNATIKWSMSDRLNFNSPINLLETYGYQPPIFYSADTATDDDFTYAQKGETTINANPDRLSLTITVKLTQNEQLINGLKRVLFSTSHGEYMVTFNEKIQYEQLKGSGLTLNLEIGYS